MREATYSTANFSSLASATVRDTLDDVASSFRARAKPNPLLDSHGKFAYILQQQLKSYKSTDPKTKQQKAITCSILRELRRHNQTARDIAAGQLASGAFFFAMRSCEYLKVPKGEERQTKLLCLDNVQFRRRHALLSHSNNLLAFADTVTLCFENQKNGEKFEEITQHKTGDPMFCPVLIWANIVQRVRSYPGTHGKTSVCTYFEKGVLKELTSQIMNVLLKATVAAIGIDKLGFGPDDIGTHSIRAGAAMAMYLDGVPVFTIMLMGRWSSDAFLKYIRKQVEQFSHNVASRMIKNQHFYHIPAFLPTVSAEDPRQHNHPANFATRQNLGRNLTSQVRMASFALFT
jgi:hypothetical protein